MSVFIRTSVLTIMVVACLAAFVHLAPPTTPSHVATSPAPHEHHKCGSSCTQELAAQFDGQTDPQRQAEIDAYLAMIDPVISQLSPDAGHCFCFAPDTDADLVSAFCAEHPELCGNQDGPRHELVTRWSGGNQGDPMP